MLALSPPSFFTTYGLTQNLEQDYNEANSYHSFLDFNDKFPELRKQVETLEIKKEKLSSCSSSTNIRNRSATEAKVQRIPSVVSSVSVLDEKKVVIQLISSLDHMNKKKDICLLSKALEYLEEEIGLVLLDATTFKCLGDKRFSNTLHFQVQDGHKIEAEKLKDKLSSLYQ